MVETVCIFLIFLIPTLQILVECETQESKVEYTKRIYINLKHTCAGFRVNQHLIVLNLYNALINKIMVTEFITLKVSWNLNSI